MPKTPTDYSKSVIYKIEHIDKPELVYVGSTTDFTKRKYQHKSDCKNENKKSYNLKLYRMIRENQGFESFKIMIICEFPCNSKTELLIEEEKYRKELQGTLNSVKAYYTSEETQINKKQCDKNYREANKGKIKEYQDFYSMQYRENNKEKIKEKNRKYRDNNKEKINELQKVKMTCCCGSIFRKGNKSIHEKTITHCQFIQQTEMT